MGSERFKVVRGEDLGEDQRDLCGDDWALVDTSTGRVIGCGGGEPEDQLLVRDWAWVPDELNGLDARIRDLEAEVERLQALEDEVREYLADEGPCENADIAGDGVCLRHGCGHPTYPCEPCYDCDQLPCKC